MAHYWNGPGVFSFKGKDYLPGEEIKGLDKKQADAMTKKGALSDEAPKVGRPSSELSQLREQVKELSEKLKAAPSADELEKLQGKLDASEKAVAELTDQLVKVQKEAAGVTAAAGPKK